MSGGSLNYLYCASLGDLFARINDIEKCEKYLIEKGYLDVAKDVRRLIEYLLSAENRISVLSEALCDVFHSVEWRISGDYEDDALEMYITKYRGAE